MSTEYDVVVVGGRVAGASTAMLLARAGARVALLERSAHGSDTVSTHALMRAGVLQLSRWGLLDTLVAGGTPPIRRTDFHYADGESVRVTIRPTAGVDALYAPRRHHLDRVLVDAAADAGVDVRHEVTVIGLQRDRDGRVTGVRARTRAGAPVDLAARFVVGADGLRSQVGDLVEAPFVRRGSAASSVLYRYFADLPAPGYEWAYGPGGGAGLIPTDDGLSLVFVGGSPTLLRELRRQGTAAAFDSLLARTAPKLVRRVRAARPEGRMHGWAGAPGHVRRSWGPGWALVGDAGYFRDPITTHGMTDALRDAELLADAILETLSGVTPERQAMAGYQRTRDQLSRALFDATEAVAAYDWELDEVRGLLRRVSAAMADELELLQARPTRAAGTGTATDIAHLPR